MYVCIIKIEWETLIPTCYYSTNVFNYDNNMNDKNKIDLIQIKVKRRLSVPSEHSSSSDALCRSDMRYDS